MGMDALMTYAVAADAFAVAARCGSYAACAISITTRATNTAYATAAMMTKITASDGVRL